MPWQVVDNATDVPITCATAGAVDVELDISAVQFAVTYAQASVPNESGGEIVVVLSRASTYTLDVFLLDAGNAALSEAHPPTIDVGCPSFTTPTVILPVNQ